MSDPPLNVSSVTQRLRAVLPPMLLLLLLLQALLIQLIPRLVLLVLVLYLRNSKLVSLIEGNHIVVLWMSVM